MWPLQYAVFNRLSLGHITIEEVRRVYYLKSL